MNRESMDKVCERGILVLVLAILIFAPLAFGGRSQDPIGSQWDFILVNPFAIVMALTLGVIALWSARLWVNPRPQLLWPPVCWGVVSFAVYAVVRYLFSDIEYVARGEMIQVLVYAFLFLAIVNNLQRQGSTQIIALTLVFLAMAISFYALYQFFTGSDKVWGLLKPYEHRGSGTFISPNNLGGFLEMILPLGLAYTLTSRVKPLTKVFTGYASLVILGGIVVTVSRGSWVATAVALTVFFLALLFHHAHRLPALALLLLLLAGAALFAPRDIYIQTRFRQLTDSRGRVSDDGRFGIWQAAIKLWHENPWFGIGPAHFNSRFGKYRPEPVQTSPERVHNDYLNTLADWGIIGVALVAGAFVLLYAGALRTWRAVRGSENTLGERRSSKLALVLGASTGLLAILVHSIVDFNMHLPANALVVVALMALLTGYFRFGTDDYWSNARTGAKALLTTGLAAGFIYLGWQTVRLSGESVWLIRAQRADVASPEQIAALEKEFAIEPRNPDTAQAIGEDFRLLSWQNKDDYETQAAEAMKWFQRAVDLNPYADGSILRYGMCLDQIGKHDEAFAYFDKANRIDPNSYFNNAYMGWHYVQAGDYAAAQPWLERSHRLEWKDNPVADSYLQICKDRLIETATNSGPLQWHSSSPQITLPPWDGK
jgi:O-antigen ligase